MTITAGFLLFPEQLFQSFMKEEQMIQAGIQYMKRIEDNWDSAYVYVYGIINRWCIQWYWKNVHTSDF